MDLALSGIDMVAQCRICSAWLDMAGTTPIGTFGEGRVNFLKKK